MWCVPSSESPLDHLQERVIVRNKNLHIVTKLGDLGRRADEIRHRPRSAVPNKDMKPATEDVRARGR